MSTIDRYANAIRNGDREALYQAMLELGRFIDASNVATGGIQRTKVDDPGNAARPVSVPPLANVTISGSTGSFKVSITNPQAVNALSANQRISQLNQNPGVNVPATMLYHQVQSATDQTFSSNVNLVDHGISPQTVYTIPDTGYIKYFRIRSSYDQKSWNQWQVKAAGDSGASALNLQTNGNVNGSQGVLNLVGDVSDDGNGNITITNSRGIPLPGDKRFLLWEAGDVPDPFLHALNDAPSLIDGAAQAGIIAPSATDAFCTYIRVNPGNLGSSRQWNGRNYAYTGVAGAFEAKLRGYNALTGFRVWVGVSDCQLHNTDTTVGTGNFIGFYYRSTVSLNWMCRVGTAVAMSELDSGVPISLVKPNKLHCEFDGIGKVSFYIDGALVGAILSNYPVGVAHAYLGFGGTNLAGSGFNGIAAQYVYAELVTP